MLEHPEPGMRLCCYLVTPCACAVLLEHIAGKTGRFWYDPIVDRDLVVLGHDAAALPESPPLSPRAAQAKASPTIPRANAFQCPPAKHDLCVVCSQHHTSAHV